MEIEFEGVKLRVHEDGTIERFWRNLKWRLIKGTNANGYLQISINNKMYYFHRIIGMVYLGLNINDTTQQIDHINRIKNDNRVENLRVVNSAENRWNVDVKGYWKTKYGWVAEIRFNGERKSKNFKTETAAIIWRTIMEERHHKIF